MGKMSKDKGARGERELASKMREYGYDSHRGVQYKGGPDSPDVIGLDGVHIEVKRTERLNLYDALAQSKRDSGDNLPIVIHRKNNSEWVVIQPLADWIKLYREWDFTQKDRTVYKGYTLGKIELDAIKNLKSFCEKLAEGGMHD